VGFQPNFTGVISTIPSCAQYQHILLRYTKWPTELKKEKFCPAFIGQTTGWISIKLYRSDRYHPSSCAHHWHVPLCCTKWPPELKIEKSCLAFTGHYWLDFNQPLEDP
jgi:hypothetical protein